MENIKPIKIIYDKNQYEKVIDTSFTQLVSSPTTSSIENTISVQQFFQYYKELFFIIPKFGDINSHQYLINTSNEYIGINTNDELIQALIDETTQLRQENLKLQQQIISGSI